MPVPVEMTFLEAVSAVKIACGQNDDGASNPLLDIDIKGHLNRACRILQREAEWLAQDRRSVTQLSGNRRYVELPSDGQAGRVSEVRWSDAYNVDLVNVILVPMAGIDHRTMVSPGLPLAYDVSPTTGITSAAKVSGGTGYSASPTVTISGGSRDANGSDPVLTAVVQSGVITSLTVVSTGTGWSTAPTITITDSTGTGASYTAALGPIQALELWPAASNTGTLEVLYRSQAYTLVNDTDVLPFDSEAITGKAALLTAVAKALPIATALGTVHDLYMKNASRQQRPGRSASFSAWRRDGWDYRQITSDG